MSKYSVLSLAAKQHLAGANKVSIDKFLASRGVPQEEFNAFLKGEVYEDPGLAPDLEEKATVETPAETITETIIPTSRTADFAGTGPAQQAPPVSDEVLYATSTEQDRINHGREEPAAGYTPPPVDLSVEHPSIHGARPYQPAAFEPTAEQLAQQPSAPTTAQGYQPTPTPQSDVQALQAGPEGTFRTGPTTTSTGTVIGDNLKQEQRAQAIAKNKRGDLASALRLDTILKEREDVQTALGTTAARFQQLFPEIGTDKYQLGTDAFTAVKTATSKIANGLTHLNKDIETDGRAISATDYVRTAFDANLVEVANATAFGIAALAGGTASRSELDRAIISDEAKAKIRSQSKSEEEYQSKLDEIYDTENTAFEQQGDEAPRPSLVPQSVKSLMQEGSTVSQATKKLEGAITKQLGERQQAAGDKSLAAAYMLQTLVDSGYFTVIDAGANAEPRVFFTSKVAQDAQSFTKINNLLFKQPRGAAQSTPGDVGNGSPVPTFVGEGSNGRVKQVIDRVNGEVVPTEISSMATSLSAVQNFTHVGAWKTANFMTKVMEGMAGSDVSPKNRTALERLAHTMLNFKGTEADPDAFLAGYADFDLKASAKSTFIYSDRSLKSMGEQASEPDQQPRFNVFRIDPTSYRLYVPGGEFNWQGNTIIRNVSTGTTNKVDVMNTARELGSKFSDETAKGVSQQPVLNDKDVNTMFDWAKKSKMEAPSQKTQFQAAILGLALNLVPHSRFFSPQSVMKSFTYKDIKDAGSKYEKMMGIMDPDKAAERRSAWRNVQRASDTSIKPMDAKEAKSWDELNASGAPNRAKQAWFYKAGDLAAAGAIESGVGNSVFLNPAEIEQFGLAPVIEGAGIDPSKRLPMATLEKLLLQAEQNSNAPAIELPEAIQAKMHQAVAAQEMINEGLKKKTWGTKLKALEAAYNLVDGHRDIHFARDGSTSTKWKVMTDPWSHNIEVEADMTSAGRTFAAINTATKAALEAGAYARNEAYDSEIGFLFPDGTSRTNATETMTRVLADQEKGPKDASNVETLAVAANISEAIKNGRDLITSTEMDKYMAIVENQSLSPAERRRGEMGMKTAEAGLGALKEFDDAFMKSGLMTKDYGETIWNNSAAVRGFLGKAQKALDNHLDVNGTLNPNANITDPVEMLYANIYKQFLDDKGQFQDKKWSRFWDHYYRETISQEIDVWGSEVPKTIARGLSMFNVIPIAKGFFGEILSIGAQGLRPKIQTGTATTVGDRLIAGVEKFNDPTARPVKKSTGNKAIIRKGTGYKVGDYVKGQDGKDYAKKPDGKLVEVDLSSDNVKIVNTDYYVGAAGSAAANSIGPALGQAAETSWFAWLDRDFAKRADNGWFHTRPETYQKYVFDNVAADPITALLYSANAKKAMVAMMEKNVARDYVDQNFKQLEDMVSALRRRGREKVEVGPNSEFSTLHEYLQDQFSAYDKARIDVAEGGDKGRVKTVRSKAEKLLKYYNHGVWTPDFDVILAWVDSSGAARKEKLKGKDNVKETRQVNARYVGDAIFDEFVSPLVKPGETTGGKERWKAFREVVNNQWKKPALIEAILKNNSGWMQGGLD